MHLYKDGTDKQLDKIYLMSSVSLAGVAEVVRGHGGPPPKSLDSDENFKP